MLTTLSTLKSRLAIAPADTSNDALLTAAIQAVSARFDQECNRTLARTENATHEFLPEDTQLIPACYPIESVTRWEAKFTETEGWVEQPAPSFLIRSACVISLAQPLLHIFMPCTCRLTYTGGYLLPGSPPPDPPVAACQGLPADLEQAAVEQVAFWFQKRDKLGLKNYWPSGGTYLAFGESDLLRSVQEVLARHSRIII